MKRIFRRNQVIITTLAIMIAAAGYLNYSAKKEVAGSDVFEAGMMEISDEDILAENQAVNRADDGTLKEIQSLDAVFPRCNCNMFSGIFHLIHHGKTFSCALVGLFKTQIQH